MFKKLLTIAMIGTSLVSFARVNMFFRDAVLAMPDMGGHFFSWHTEGSDEVLYKSLHEGTTIEELVKYMHEDAEKVDEQLGLANGPFAGQCTENGWWPANEADMCNGPRYFRTCKPNVTGFAAKEDRPNVPVPVSGGPANWTEAGYNADHVIIAWDYITNVPHSGGGAIMLQEFSGYQMMGSMAYTVSENWQTNYERISIPQNQMDEWAAKSTYMWITHNGWQNSPKEIVIRVKNLRLLTLAEAEAECASSTGDTNLSLTNGNGNLVKDVDENGNEIWMTTEDTTDYNPIFFTNGIIPNIPAENTFLKFDYKISLNSGAINFFVDKTSAGAPTQIATSEEGLLAPEDESADITTEDCPWNEFSIDLAEGIATWEFAKKFGSNDRLWIQLKNSTPDETLLYIKNVRLTTENGGSSAIEDVVTDKAGALKAAGLNGAIAVEAAGAFTVYNLAGVAVAAGEGVQTVEVEAGLYVVVADKAAQKVVVK